MTNKIKESNITDGAVTSDKIAPGTIANDRLAGSISNDKLAGSIAISKLATDPTNASNISSGTLANARLTGSGAITVNGTSIALGASGDISAGTDWQAVKTANYTAVAGQGIFANTSGGAFTITLPASPTIGDEVHIVDYARTFASNAVTVDRNGSKIDTVETNFTLSTNGLSVRFVFIDATQGWRAIFDDVSTSYGATFISATGGTESTSGSYKIHTFNSSSNFVVSSVGNPAGSTTVDYLVVAGGGGGGAGAPGDGGAGGGAGGARMSAGTDSGSYTSSPLGTGVSAITVSAQTYPITVGAGGSLGSGVPGGQGSKGSDSTFSTITSSGGGGGDAANTPATADTSGGSGGGSHQQGPGGGLFAGNTPPVSPPQGNDGGANAAHPTAGGGGGAGAAGTPAAATAGSKGGAGITNAITGSSVGYAGGGAGGGSPGRSYPDVGGPDNDGFPFGGGNSGSAPRPGSANKGGGGGGGSDNAAGNGGSGVVILRYQYQ